MNNENNVNNDGITNFYNADNNDNNNFYNFNTAEEAESYDLIPKGTLAKVKLMLRPGGHNDESQGWTGGYATRSQYTGAVYLKCEYTILSGEYQGCKVLSMIGLYSHKNENIWGAIGRSFIRSILNSRSGFTDKDESPESIAARQIQSFAELNGIEFVARIDIETDANGNERNVIKKAITAEHKQYNSLMTQISSADNALIDDELPWTN